MALTSLIIRNYGGNCLLLDSFPFLFHFLNVEIILQIFLMKMTLYLGLLHLKLWY